MRKSCEICNYHSLLCEIVIKTETTEIWTITLCLKHTLPLTTYVAEIKQRSYINPSPWIYADIIAGLSEGKEAYGEPSDSRRRRAFSKSKKIARTNIARTTNNNR